MFSMLLRTLILAIWHVLIMAIARYMVALATEIRRINTTPKRVVADPVWLCNYRTTQKVFRAWKKTFVMVYSELDEEPVNVERVTDDLNEEWVEV